MYWLANFKLTKSHLCRDHCIFRDPPMCLYSFMYYDFIGRLSLFNLVFWIVKPDFNHKKIEI